MNTGPVPCTPPHPGRPRSHPGIAPSSPGPALQSVWGNPGHLYQERARFAYKPLASIHQSAMRRHSAPKRMEGIGFKIVLCHCSAVEVFHFRVVFACEARVQWCGNNRYFVWDNGQIPTIIKSSDPDPRPDLRAESTALATSQHLTSTTASRAKIKMISN